MSTRTTTRRGARPSASCVDEGRGALPYALIHGEALVACAAWALGEAGVTPVDIGRAVGGIAGRRTSRSCCTTRCAR